MEFVLGRGLVTSQDELWRPERRLIQPAFHRERIRIYEKTAAERAQAMLDGWHDGAGLELSSAMSRLKLDTVGRAVRRRRGQGRA